MTILEKVLTHDLPDLAAARPKEVYHYTSLETIFRILENDNIRLSHAEYSNDRHEILDAIDLIRSELTTSFSHSAGSFPASVSTTFESILLVGCDRYIFCTCQGLDSAVLAEDMLSQWRAYAQDGRGGAISIELRGLTDIVNALPGILRINPVIYDRTNKMAFVQAILNEGISRHASGSPTAIADTADALVFCLPLMKHEGFQEEREWRLIYSPGSLAPTLKFHPRRDFLAPYIDLRDLWTAAAKSCPPLKPAVAGVAPADGSLKLPISAITVGPSPHLELNVRSMQKVVAQLGTAMPIRHSAIPYRSVA